MCWYVTNKPPQEELLTDNEVLNKYEHSHSMSVITSQRGTLDVARMLTCIDKTHQGGTSTMSEGGRWGHS